MSSESDASDRGCVPAALPRVLATRAEDKRFMCVPHRMAFTTDRGASRPLQSHPALRCHTLPLPHCADFEDGVWEEGEFYARRRRRRPQAQGKDAAIYGVFGDGDKPAPAPPKAGARAGLTFVSSSGAAGDAPRVVHASRQPGHHAGSSDEEAGEDSSDDEDLERQLPAFSVPRGASGAARAQAPSPATRPGLGGASQRAGLGAGLGSAPSQSAAPAAVQGNFGSWTKFSSGFAGKYLSRFGFKGRLGKREQGISQPVGVKARPAKLGLGAAGFKEATHMKQNKAIVEELRDNDPLGGMKRAREASERAQSPDQASDSEPATAAGAAPATRAPKRPKRVYKTAAEVLSDTGPTGGSTLVVDMTAGGAPRVVGAVSDLTGGEGRAASGGMGAASQRSFVATMALGQELLHNLDLVMEAAAGDVARVGARARAAQANVGQLRGDIRALQDTVESLEAEESAVARAAEAWGAVQAAAAPARQGLPSVRAFADAVAQFMHAHPKQAMELSVSSALPGMLSDCLPQALAAEKWSPVSEGAAAALTAAISPWLRLVGVAVTVDGAGLQQDVTHEEDGGAAARHVQRLTRMLHSVTDAALGPLLRRGVAADTWNPRTQSGPVLEVVAALQGAGATPPHALLSEAAQQSWLVHHVAPILVSTARSWNPDSDSIPLHAWLQPWSRVPEVAPALASAMPGIVKALEGALEGWHPSDASASAMFAALQPILPPATMQKSLARTVTPRLVDALAEAGASVRRDPPPALTWLAAWQGILPDAELVAMLASAFLPRWLAHLNAATASQELGLSAAVQCVDGVFSALPPPLREAAVVQDVLETALRVLGHHASTRMAGGAAATQLPPLPDTMPLAQARVALVQSDGRSLAPQPEGHVEEEGAKAPRPSRQPSAPEAAPALDEHRVSLLDAIGHAAAGLGLPFVPTGKRVDGAAVYRLGDTSVLVRGGVVWKEGGPGKPFTPVPVQNLLPRRR